MVKTRRQKKSRRVGKTRRVRYRKVYRTFGGTLKASVMPQSVAKRISDAQHTVPPTGLHHFTITDKTPTYRRPTATNKGMWAKKTTIVAPKF
jgi:hypothetical protein